MRDDDAAAALQRVLSPHCHCSWHVQCLHSARMAETGCIA